MQTWIRPIEPPLVFQQRRYKRTQSYHRLRSEERQADLMFAIVCHARINFIFLPL